MPRWSTDAPICPRQESHDRLPQESCQCTFRCSTLSLSKALPPNGLHMRGSAQHTTHAMTLVL